jgi:hypothetical protein
MAEGQRPHLQADHRGTLSPNQFLPTGKRSAEVGLLAPDLVGPLQVTDLHVDIVPPSAIGMESMAQGFISPEQQDEWALWTVETLRRAPPLVRDQFGMNSVRKRRRADHSSKETFLRRCKRS